MSHRDHSYVKTLKKICCLKLWEASLVEMSLMRYKGNHFWETSGECCIKGNFAHEFCSTDFTNSFVEVQQVFFMLCLKESADLVQDLTTIGLSTRRWYPFRPAVHTDPLIERGLRDGYPPGGVRMPFAALALRKPSPAGSSLGPKRCLWGWS